jgi:hypothetical protein
LGEGEGFSYVEEDVEGYYCLVSRISAMNKQASAEHVRRYRVDLSIWHLSNAPRSAQRHIKDHSLGGDTKNVNRAPFPKKCHDYRPNERVTKAKAANMAM